MISCDRMLGKMFFVKRWKCNSSDVTLINVIEVEQPVTSLRLVTTIK